MDSDLTKAVLRAILDEACGIAGRFVQISELAATEGFARDGTAAVVGELLARRWVYRSKTDLVYITAAGLERLSAGTDR